MLSEKMQKMWKSFSDEEKEAIDVRYNDLRDEVEVNYFFPDKKVSIVTAP